MASKADLDGKIETLALKLADEMLADHEMDKTLIDGFKALSGYWTSSRKIDKTGDDENDGSGFDGIKDRLGRVTQ